MCLLLLLFFKKIIYLFSFVCVCVGLSTYKVKCLWSPEEDVRSPRAGGFVFPNMGTGSRTCVRTMHVFNVEPFFLPYLLYACIYWAQNKCLKNKQY